jgi:hypothetical protein
MIYTYHTIDVIRIIIYIVSTSALLHVLKILRICTRTIYTGQRVSGIIGTIARPLKAYYTELHTLHLIHTKEILIQNTRNH